MERQELNIQARLDRPRQPLRCALAAALIWAAVAYGLSVPAPRAGGVGAVALNVSPGPCPK
jgi:hypothetical protein